MLDILHLFVGNAWAQDAGAAAPASSGLSMATIPGFAPFLIIMVLFIFMIYLPEQKRAAARDKMIKSLMRGDRVITSGGVYGKITKIEDDTLTVEIADGVNVKMVRTQVQGLAAKTDTTAVANDSDEEKKN